MEPMAPDTGTEEEELAEPVESTVTDLYGDTRSGLVTSLTESDWSPPIFQPSELAELDTGSYLLEMDDGTLRSATYQTWESDQAVMDWYMNTLPGAIIDQQGVISGGHYRVLVQGGEPTTFEIQEQTG